MLGVDVDLTGTGRTAEVTWNFKRYNGTKPGVRISVDSEEGFRLKSSDDNGIFSTRITSVVPKGDLYSVYASVSQSGTDTRFTLTVFDSSGVLRDTQTVLYASNLKGNLAMTSVKAHGNLGGSGTSWPTGISSPHV